jgi:hypothetical protein
MNMENTTNSPLRTGMYFLLGTLGCMLCSIPAFSQIATAPSATHAQHVAIERDGQRDFDFEIGTWTTHLTRLQHPLAGSTAWINYEGTSVVRKIWNGRANLVELNVDGAAGHIQGLSLRLYNLKSHQWSLNYANGRDGVLGQPTVGEFKNGRGEFYDQEPFDGRIILVRSVWSDITPTSCHFEQAFSEDGGKTWEVNWIATDTRLKADTDGSFSTAGAKEVRTEWRRAGIEADGQHGFDFEIGTWKIHLSRLQDRLAGSKTWIKFDGTSVTQKVWDGRANLEEFETDSSTGHIEGLTLRLYNPQTHQWRIYWANSQDPDLGQPIQPMVGEFKNGHGEFYDQELWKGRTVYVRFLWSEMMPNSAHFEQSYSDDGGKTWEVNWITNQSRDEPSKH